MTKESDKSDFLYVTYIRVTPSRLWAALTDPETIRRYWFGMNVDCAWHPGAPWRLSFKDGRVADEGEVVQYDPPHCLVLRWRNVWNEAYAAEGEARCTFEIEPLDGGVTRLTVHHTMPRAGSGLIGAVSGGWPRILSNLKSLLETEQLLFAA